MGGWRAMGEVGAPGRAGWLVLLMPAAVLGVATAIGSVVLLVLGRWMEGVLGLLQVVACYWFAAGAWLRTPWADVARREPPPGPPVLTERRARSYVVLAGVMSTAVVVAAVVQLVLSRG